MWNPIVLCSVTLLTCVEQTGLLEEQLRLYDRSTQAQTQLLLSHPEGMWNTHVHEELAIQNSLFLRMPTTPASGAFTPGYGPVQFP